MPSNLVRNKEDESLWAKAKAHAKAEGHGKDYAYITSIFERMRKGAKLKDAAAAEQKKRNAANYLKNYD